MGNWEIENADGSRITLVNVSFCQGMQLPHGVIKVFPLDNNCMQVTTGGSQIELDCGTLEQIEKTDDGFIFLTSKKKVCGMPQINGHIILSGINGDEIVQVSMNDILKASICADYNVQFTWEAKSHELVCEAKAVDLSNHLIKKVTISSQFETAIDFENQLGSSIKDEMEKLAREELRILLSIDNFSRE